jgi:hypothetical protein
MGGKSQRASERKFLRLGKIPGLRKMYPNRQAEFFPSDNVFEIFEEIQIMREFRHFV